MLHINDNQGNSDAHLPPGKGHINWRAIIKQLLHYQFRGTLILELAGHGDPEEIMRGAREARHYLRQVCREREKIAQTWGEC